MPHRAMLPWLSTLALVASLATCARPLRSRSTVPLRLAGAWRLVETAARVPGTEWERRSVPQGGVYVFAARHYSYFYVRGAGPRPRFADGNRPTETERAATFDTFIAGAGTYAFDGRTLELGTEFRKNPNEMGTGSTWRWQVERVAGDTLSFVFVDPPFLPGREWRTTLVRLE